MTTLVAICDVLEADGGWMDTELICDEVTRRHPHWKRDSVRRSLSRLLSRGAIERRLSPTTIVGTGTMSRIVEPRRAQYRVTDNTWSLVNEGETRGRNAS